jgi:uncharacterized protein
MKYKRFIDLSKILQCKSLFIFGPRQTGKSTWLKSEFADALYINLLKRKDMDFYLSHSNGLESEIQKFIKINKSNIVIIDEIQKMPQLLDEVHDQIEKNKNLRFILTGSSARKLKKEGVNLLGGRASWRKMFPLVYPEIKNELNTIEDLERRLLFGGLPSIFLSEAPFDDLQDYLGLYLNEEIRLESFVHNYEIFHRFLKVAVLSNTQQINFSEIGSDAEVPARTVYDYFKILEDTLIGFMLKPFSEKQLRKAVAAGKFYLFDTGVANALVQRNHLKAETAEFGNLFEHFVITEVRAAISYLNLNAEIFFWRTTSGLEVDLIIKTLHEIFAIEIKAKDRITYKDYKHILSFAQDFKEARKIVVSLEGRRITNEDQVEIIPVFDFLKQLWSEELIKNQL